MSDQTGLMSDLTSRMQWLSDRQQVLTQNIANSDTPGYRAMELSQPSFKKTLSGVQSIQLATTNPMHMSPLQTSSSAGVMSINKTPSEVYPTGNSVNLEDETRKAAENAMNFQLVSSVYKREMGMLMKAAGKSS